MASDFLIQGVASVLSDDAASMEGFDDEGIGAKLDSGLTMASIASSFWRAKAAATSSLVSVSESGSTRDLGSIHKNAIAMMEYWDKQVEKERQIEDGESPKRTRVRFHRTTRI